MQANQAISALAVFNGADHVGTLYRTDPLSFEYSGLWLAHADARPLYAGLPLAPGRIQSSGVHAFFENLLPEGDQRKLISAREQVSTVFGLLAAIGGESVGSYVLVPEGQAPQPPVYQPLSWEQVRILVHADGQFSKEREKIETAAAGMPKPRMSISGAQLKMLLFVDEQGAPHRPMGTSPSTHILKPDIVRADSNVFASAANEALVMRTAALCGLPTANVSYQSVAKACLIQRFDRVRRPDGRLQRLWQADLCQLSGRASDVKYEADGGPSFAECYAMVAAHSSRPAVDQKNLLKWLFFNLYVGNNDSHAKNLSIIQTPDGLKLAPFYDLMSTRVYSGLGSKFALSIGGQFEPGKIGKEEFAALAKSIGVAPRYLDRIGRELALRMSQALEQAQAEIEPLLTPGDHILVERVASKIARFVRQFSSKLFDTEPEPADGKDE